MREVTGTDSCRHAHVGSAVHLRGLLEISNYCARHCAYCGLRADSRSVERYRMGADEILEGARSAEQYGYGTLVMQAGEDYGITREWLADVIRAINGHAINTPARALEIYTKMRTASHVTLSYTRRNKTVSHEYVIR